MENYSIERLINILEIRYKTVEINYIGGEWKIKFRNRKGFLKEFKSMHLKHGLMDAYKNAEV